MTINRTAKRSRRASVGSSSGIIFFILSTVSLFSVVSTAFLQRQQSTTRLTAGTANIFIDFVPPPTRTVTTTVLFESLENTFATETAAAANPEVVSLKSDLIALAERTSRGFTSSAEDKRKATQIIESLQRFQTISDPARSYYDPSASSSVTTGDSDIDSSTTTSISGKWNLIYTDAPDITGLDTSRNPFSTAKLGRIGQECSPPYIKNVIEWLRPDWAKNLPFSGSDRSRILQKVVTSGSATPAKPTFVDLKVAGLELEAGNVSGISDSDKGNSEGNSNNVVESIQSQGLPAGILSLNPVDLKGPLNPPFGRFEILYLDDELRAIRTSQNFLAVNRRIIDKDDEWF